jgi:hypothetical protein
MAGTYTSALRDVADCVNITTEAKTEGLVLGVLGKSRINENG